MLRRAVIHAAVALIALSSAPAFSQRACDNERIFSGGASSDLGISYSSQLNSTAMITIGGLLCPRPEHVGLSADLYVAFEIDDLTAYSQQVVLEGEMQQSIFNGIIGFVVPPVKQKQ